MNTTPRPRTATPLQTVQTLAMRLLAALAFWRLFRRLEELLALWRAGALPAPAAPRPRATPSTPTSRPTRPSYPRERATAHPRPIHARNPRAGGHLPANRPAPARVLPRAQGATWHPSIPQWPPRAA